jgi:hypothetical protein
MKLTWQPRGTVRTWKTIRRSYPDRAGRFERSPDSCLRPNAIFNERKITSLPRAWRNRAIKRIDEGIAAVHRAARNERLRSASLQSVHTSVNAARVGACATNT